MDRIPPFFSPKTLYDALEPIPTNINWFQYIPSGEQLRHNHSAALDAALTRLCKACAEAKSSPSSDRLGWIADFLNVVDDLQALDVRVAAPLYAPQHRCNEVFQSLKTVLFHPNSSDAAVEQACSLINLLLPPPSQSNIACDTDWRPFYLLLKQCGCCDNSFRSGADSPSYLVANFINCIQVVAYYFSPESGDEIQDELRSHVRKGLFLDACALTTFLPPQPSCLRSLLPDIFCLWDLTLDSKLSSSAREIIDCRCLSAIAFAARCTMFPLRAAHEAIDWSPYIDSIFSHALRFLGMFNDADLIHATPPSHQHSVPSNNPLWDLSFTIICLLFISPSVVSVKIDHLLCSVDHVINPLAASDELKVKRSALLISLCTRWFSEIMARFDAIHSSLQQFSHADAEGFITTLLPHALTLLHMLPSYPFAGVALKRLYTFRPDLVAPKIATNLKLILEQSIDCPDAFDCIPLLLNVFDAALFVPLHRIVDAQLPASADDFLRQMKRVHGARIELPDHTRPTGDQASSLALFGMLPVIAETLLPRVDAGVESSNAALRCFHHIFRCMPSLPLPQPLQAPPGLHIDAAAVKIITRVNSFFVRPAAFQGSFCARFFNQIISFCEQADQPEFWMSERDQSMGSKSDVTRTTESWFQPCVECFIAHLPLKCDLAPHDAGVFSFDDALHALLQHCRANSAMHLPVYTLAIVSACMSAHSEATSRLFMPFLMDQLLRPAAAATPTATPLPVRHNRVVGTRNEKILRYFAGILDAVLSGVRSNAARTYLLGFVPQMYDLDRFLLATRPRQGAASSKMDNKSRNRHRSENRDEQHVAIIGAAKREEDAPVAGGKSDDKGAHTHQIKHLSSDGCDLVASLLHCFCAPTATDSLFVPNSIWNNPKWRSMHFISWGRGVDPAHAEVNFDIPTRVHLRCASAIFRHFAVAPLCRLVQIANGVCEVEEDDLTE